MALLLCACLSLIVRTAASSPTPALFLEEFEGDAESRWVHSSDPAYTGRATFETPKDFLNLDDTGLRLPVRERRYGLSRATAGPIDLSTSGIVLQYALKTINGISCGGAYLKFLSHPVDGTLNAETPYSVMFGPDACGSKRKVHLILMYKDPITQTFKQKPIIQLIDPAKNRFYHYFTAVFRTDNTYAVYMDWEVVAEGSIHEDFLIDPPKEIPDPTDIKPADWIDDDFIPDPQFPKPADWNEDAEEFIEDLGAVKPSDWNEKEQGPWVPPMKKNVLYKGPYDQPKIPNPLFKGEWVPRSVSNPQYKHDQAPLTRVPPIGGVAVEVWTLDSDYVFDDILVTHSEDTAREHFEKHGPRKMAAEDAFHKADKARYAREEGARLATKLRGWLEHPALLPYKPYTKRLVHMVYYHPWTFHAMLWSPAVVSVVVLIAVLLYSRRPRVQDEPLDAAELFRQMKGLDIGESDATIKKAAAEEAEAERKIKDAAAANPRRRRARKAE